MPVCEERSAQEVQTKVSDDWLLNPETLSNNKKLLVSFVYLLYKEVDACACACGCGCGWRKLVGTSTLQGQESVGKVLGNLIKLRKHALYENIDNM